jgi:fatty-acyl-CoA synthase
MSPDRPNAETIWQALEQAASERGDRTAYIYQGQEITFREVSDAAGRVACGLLDLGFEKGDRIGIIGLNQPEWLYTYFAAAKIGAVVVGLNVRYRESELDYIINHSQARAILTLPSLGDMDYVEFFSTFRERIPSVKDYIFLGEGGFSGSRSFSELLAAPADPARLEKASQGVTPEDLIIIIYTSGTTGRPKGGAISHQSQLASARAQAEHTRSNPEDLFALALPFNHVGGITCGVLTSLIGGGTCVLIPMFNPPEIIETMKNYRNTIATGVPTMHSLLLMNENFQTVNTDSIRLVITGGSNAEPALLERLHASYPNATVMNLYGLSESSGAVVLSPWESDFEHTVKSIGKPIGDFQVKVVDETGSTLPPSQTGEICFKGDAIVSGYFRMPEETKAAFDAEGWLKTGDMGYLDEDGYIILMGRKKEMFIQGGFNVYPVEVENLLTKHPKVAMAAGIGVPDPVLGEVGRYYIVPNPGESPTEDEIREYCKKHLADYKVPKQVVFKSELPLTPVGKIMKSRLKEIYEEKGE